ncbi:MAG TPA: molybdopterin molybdotransferase MoeA [Myxococcota bacterium]|nr:molybdopterin molybdotransferase MoeA [Myxococcota bacterium]
MSANRTMIPREEAFHRLDRTLSGKRLSFEKVPLPASLGRVLAVDHLSRLEMPPFDKSAMDGYAVRADDEREEYRLVGAVAAGETFERPIEPGTTVKIMTGAPVPPGGGRVIKIEDSESQGDTIRILRHEGKTNIATRAQDLKVGDVVLRAGIRVGALDMANLVACGLAEAEVVRRPHLFILSTGDEIVDHPDKLAPGRIMNSNGPMLEALAGEFGLAVSGREHVDDDRDATVEAISRAMDAADIVVMSGGVSVGDYDFVLEAMQQLDLELHFSRVAILPGKPTVFASRGDKLVFGLPGNPVSSFVMFHIFILRAVAHLTGGPLDLREFPLRLAADYRRRKTERLQHVPCRVNSAGKLEPLEYHGSAHLRAISDADGFFLVPIGVDEIKSGQVATFIPLPRGFR